MQTYDFNSPLKGNQPNIRGGVHPEQRKEATADRPIDFGLPLPPMLYLVPERKALLPLQNNVL
ncbi:MAG: hypothetical protein NTX45_25070 [Proteobacteria bacterium]|nr:hypothetical protein [Pseudomonadota bacterium]